MDGYGLGSGQRSYGGDRFEIVSGKSSYGGSCQDVATNPAGEVTRSGAASVEKPRRFGDPEAKRKKRIARYKVYGVEGKVKATLRNGIRWIKDKCSRILHGH